MIYVIGMGPGHASYILPKAMEAIHSCDFLIGAKRHLRDLEIKEKEVLEFQNNFEQIKAVISKAGDKKVGVVVSGDAGFYSLLAFVKRYAAEEDIEVIPGISSLQYMFSKIKKGYENARWTSYHGREGIAYDKIVTGLFKGESFGILTDAFHTPYKIQENLIQAIDKSANVFFKEQVTLYIGERLSYDNERITKKTILDVLDSEFDSLCVMVISYEGCDVHSRERSDDQGRSTCRCNK